jgi:hypothetical protein
MLGEMQRDRRLADAPLKLQTEMIAGVSVGSRQGRVPNTSRI